MLHGLGHSLTSSFGFFLLLRTVMDYILAFNELNDLVPSNVSPFLGSVSHAKFGNQEASKSLKEEIIVICSLSSNQRKLRTYHLPIGCAVQSPCSSLSHLVKAQVKVYSEFCWALIICCLLSPKLTASEHQWRDIYTCAAQQQRALID
jgi:hypothetical protein